MNKKVKKQLFNILFVLILLTLTVVVLLKSNKELSWLDVREFFARCNPFYIVLGVGGMLAFLIAEALSVKNIAKKFGYKTKLVSAFAYSSADAYYSALTPSATGGQPASAYYMVKDGIDGGSTTFILLFNLLGYTAAIFVLGIVAFIVSIFTSVDGWVFLQLNTFSKVFILIGVVMQLFLIWLFVACLKHSGTVLKAGGVLISLLAKIKLSKKPDVLREKLNALVDKYRYCGEQIKKHRTLFLQTLLYNVLQRGSQVAITAFVLKAAEPQTNMLHVFVLQCFVLLGYNSMPLPGGAGIFEGLYMSIFSTIPFYDSTFLVVAVMVTRVISYYGCMILSGIFTLVYHVAQNGGKIKYVQTMEEIGDIKSALSANLEKNAEEAASQSTQEQKSCDQCETEREN